MKDITELIEICTQFALEKGLCKRPDEPLVRNKLMSLFKVSSICQHPVSIPESIVPVLNEMTQYAAENGMLEMDTPTYRAMFDTKICGCMLMMQSQVQEIFERLYNESPQKATDWFYKFCVDSNYIRTFDIAKNIKYDYESEYGTLEVTINLTKPEKDPKEIMLQKSMPQSNYPKCMLCIENVGYEGRLGYPSHETLRTVPVKLEGQQWNLQYSPYVYYNEHCIVFCPNHTPMTMDEHKFVRLFEFLQQFPHYFIGSNTQLPVVGGSILTHEHFQGGRHIMPMEKAAPLYEFNVHSDKVKASIINWPMTCIRLSASDYHDIIPVANKILSVWKNYTDAQCGIYAFTNNEEHNTVTPITRINSRGEYECDIVLRNNITTEEFPLGVFHPHPEKHNIKKENIGLIEVMGLFILPGRLKNELEELASVWVSGKDLDSQNIHAKWFASFKDSYSPSNQAEAMEILHSQVGLVCQNVLRDAGVYKEDEHGRAGLKRFLAACGFSC